MKTKKSLVLSLILACSPVWVAANQLSIAVVGDAQRIASVEKTLLEPFSKATGIKVQVIAVTQQDSADTPALLQRAESEKWDFLTLDEDKALLACSTGDLIQTGTKQPRKSSLLPVLRKPPTCHSLNEVRANTMVYNLDAYRRDIPNHISAFFDLERFPGKRAITAETAGLLELALMGYGVPASQVYHMLSTTRGVALAASVFQPLKDHIIWATGNADTERLLGTGAATMGILDLDALVKTEVGTNTGGAQPMPLNRLSANASLAYQTSWIKIKSSASPSNVTRQFVAFAKSSGFESPQITAGIYEDATWYHRVTPNIQSRLASWHEVLR
ncbi:MAG: extracellular solute-binding protein [Paracoccaceae bacterium]|nr:extracellular solute-binding protein [Paracoccaceae bacterium]